MRILRMGLVLGAVVVAAIAANVALLSLATGGRDSVGQLSPVVAFQSRQPEPPQAKTPPARPAASPAKPHGEPSDDANRDADD